MGCHRHKMSRHNCALRNPQVLRVISVALCLMCLIPAGAAAEKARDVAAKPSAPAPGGTAIYFIRTKDLRSWWSPEIQIDKHKVGELASGTYLVVRPPPGHHTVYLPGSMLSGSMTSEMEIAAGQTYFLELGPWNPAPGTQLIQSLILGGPGLRGQMVPGTGLLTVRFYLLDAAKGRELIAGLKNAPH
jgi:Protein of unknown function (DUF2846)